MGTYGLCGRRAPKPLQTGKQSQQGKWESGWPHLAGLSHFLMYIATFHEKLLVFKDGFFIIGIEVTILTREYRKYNT